MNVAVKSAEKPKGEVKLPQVIKKIGVIGAGQMGTGIAHVIALGGYSVSRVLLTLFWSTGSLRPVMLGALLTLVLSYALSPKSVEEEGI